MRIPKAWSANSTKSALLFGSAACAMLVAAPASAQDDVDSSDAEATSNDNVIVVTARLREENIQDVPLAITAFDDEAIDRLGLQELDDIARFTPGFSFEDFSGGFGNAVVRGQAQTRTTALETNVSTFFDGVYIPRSWAIDIGTASIDRIEIVKGPQSARYGRNAFAGAINYIPQSARVGDTTGNFEATIGIDDRYDFGGFTNFAIGDNFAIAGSYNFSSFDGSWENAHPFADLDVPGPSTKGNVGGYENESWSVSAEVDIDGFTFNAGYYRFDISREARAGREISDFAGAILDPSSIGPGDNGVELVTNCGATRFGFFNPLICGELPAPGDQTIVDPRAFGVQSDTGVFRASATVELTDGLDLSYVFSNVNGDVDTGTLTEVDPINCGSLLTNPDRCLFQPTPRGGIDYDSHDVRLTFDQGGAIRASIGGTLSDGEDEFIFYGAGLAPITDPNDFVPLNGIPIPFLDPDTGSNAFLLRNSITMTDVSSVFGEFVWTGAEGALRLGVEARYTETDITSNDLRRSIELSDKFTSFDPRFTVEYDVNPDVLVYGTVARGSKSGGFNATSRLVEDRSFEEEDNWTYELGLKSVLADGRLIFNAAAFYTDWNNIQINSADFDPNDPSNRNVPSIIRNLEGAKVYGIEMAMNYRATDNLSLDATFSHTEATYKDGVFDSRFSRGVAGFTAPCDDIVCATDGDISGNDLERQSPTQASAGIQWEDDSASMPYWLRVDGSWQSKFFADSANLGIIPDRFLVNASAGAELGPVNLRLWVRNLFDERYVSNSFVVLSPFGNSYSEFYGDRRTIGATIGYEF